MGFFVCLNARNFIRAQPPEIQVLLEEAIKEIREHPRIGSPVPFGTPGARAHGVENFQITYVSASERTYIRSIIDSNG